MRRIENKLKKNSLPASLWIGMATGIIVFIVCITGAVWGTTGYLLMFVATLFGASLPLTGYYIFFKIKKKKKRQLHL